MRFITPALKCCLLLRALINFKLSAEGHNRISKTRAEITAYKKNGTTFKIFIFYNCLSNKNVWPFYISVLRAISAFLDQNWSRRDMMK